jgi:type IV fimbrial biogenesis protein FimT
MNTFHFHKTHFGFTLVEMLITTSIVIIIFSIGAPAFTRILSDIRMSAQANDFSASVLLARSEAIKQGRTVTLCQSSDGSTCTGSNWHQGWIIFVNNSTPPNPGVVDTGDTIIKVYRDFSTEGHTLNGTANITFNPSGQNTSGPLTLALCRSDKEIVNRVITVAANSGRVQITKNYAPTGTLTSCS